MKIIIKRKLPLSNLLGWKRQPEHELENKKLAKNQKRFKVVWCVHVHFCFWTNPILASIPYTLNPKQISLKEIQPSMRKKKLLYFKGIETLMGKKVNEKDIADKTSKYI